MTTEKAYQEASRDLPPAEAKAALKDLLVDAMLKCAHRHGTILTEYKIHIAAYEAALKEIAERPARKPASFWGLPVKTKRVFGSPPNRKNLLTL